MSSEATHSTIELAHGGRVHVALPPSEVYDALYSTPSTQVSPRPRPGMVMLKRIKGDTTVDLQARAFRDFYVLPSSVIAVFPLNQRSNPE